jgi:hypothetical protein
VKFLIPVAIIGLILAFMFVPREKRIEHTCDLSKETCLLTKQGFMVTVDISPKPIDPVNSFTFTLQGKDLEGMEVKAWLIGISFVHPAEELTLKKVSDQLLSVKTNLPFCTEKLMTWRIHLQAKKDRLTYKTNFDFDVIRN